MKTEFISSKIEDESYIVGKFYRPGRWSPEAILDEHRFIDELAELEIPVAAPMTLANNSTVSSVKEILCDISTYRRPEPGRI